MVRRHLGHNVSVGTATPMLSRGGLAGLAKRLRASARSRGAMAHPDSGLADDLEPALADAASGACWQAPAQITSKHEMMAHDVLLQDCLVDATLWVCDSRRLASQGGREDGLGDVAPHLVFDPTLLQDNRRLRRSAVAAALVHAGLVEAPPMERDTRRAEDASQGPCGDSQRRTWQATTCVRILRLEMRARSTMETVMAA